MADNVFSDTIPTYHSQSSGHGDRRLTKDILLKLDSRYSKAVNIYNKYIPSEDSCSYWEGDFNQNRATAVESDMLSYSVGHSSILSTSHPSSQPIGSENRGGSVTADLHQTEYIDELPPGKRAVYYERIPATTSHHGDQSVVESRLLRSDYGVETNSLKQVAPKTPLEYPTGVQDLRSKNMENKIPVVEESLKPKARDINQPRTQNISKVASDVPSRILKNPPSPTEMLIDKQWDVSPKNKIKTSVDIPQTKRYKTSLHTSRPSVSTDIDEPIKTTHRIKSPEKIEPAIHQLQRKVLPETSRERYMQSPNQLIKHAKPERPTGSPNFTTNALTSRVLNEADAESPRYAGGLSIRRGPQNKTKPAAQSRERRQPESPGLSSTEPGSRSDRIMTDDNYDTSTYLPDGQLSFLTPDPSALRDLDNASPATLEFCDHHSVHYCFFVYFSSATVDEDLMPFRRKSFMDKVAAMDNRDEIQHMLSTKCGRDACSDRRVIAIERQSGTEIRLSDLDPDTAFIKGLPRRRLTIGGPSFSHISCALTLFEALLPNVIRSAIFPYRLPQGSSTRYSTGERISSMHNWDSGRSDGTVYLRKQFDDKGGWKSFIPYLKSEIKT